MTLQPKCAANCTALEPMPPTPNTTTVSPGCTLPMRTSPWYGVATASVSTATVAGSSLGSTGMTLR